jgi:hypothetical protein
VPANANDPDSGMGAFDAPGCLAGDLASGPRSTRFSRLTFSAPAEDL